MQWSRASRAQRVVGFGAVIVFIIGAVLTDVLLFRGDLADWVRPQPILTSASLVIGFLILRWQLSAQHTNNLAANTAKDRNALHLEIYRDLAASSEEASRGVFGLFKLSVAVDGAWALEELAGGMAVGLPSVDDLDVAYGGCSTTVIALMARMEKWEIALGPGGRVTFYRVFRDGLEALNTASARLRAAMTSPGLAVQERRAAGAALQDAVLTMTSFLWDLRVETQNRLLGDLFNHRLDPRQPMGLDVKVATLPKD